MQIFEQIADYLHPLGPLLGVAIAIVLCMGTAYWLMLRKSLAIGHDRRLPRQLVMFGLSLVAVIAIVLALPVSESTRNQLLTVLGLLGSAIVALSSTTLVANAMAGLMLRGTKSFRIGDFIRVGEQFGRVTARGLLFTEIQTEDRELTTLPNLHLISNPVTVVRTSGTLVSTNLSLGYNVHHSKIEALLLEAAKRADLEEPFVRVLELGNFAITYRVSGFLTDIKNLLTVRSKLCRSVLDALHGQGIEIVSPTFMNQRPLPADAPVIPATPSENNASQEQRPAEDLMFDKAERAERIEEHRQKLETEIAEIEEKLGDTSGEEHSRLKERLASRQKKLDALVKASESKPDEKKT